MGILWTVKSHHAMNGEPLDWEVPSCHEWGTSGLWSPIMPWMGTSGLSSSIMPWMGTSELCSPSCHGNLNSFQWQWCVWGFESIWLILYKNIMGHFQFPSSPQRSLNRWKRDCTSDFSIAVGGLCPEGTQKENGSFRLTTLKSHSVAEGIQVRDSVRSLQIGTEAEALEEYC